MNKQKFPEIGSYFDKLRVVINKLDMQSIQIFCGIVQSSYKHDGTIYICGNGGSAALASHMAIDMRIANPDIRAISLTADSAAMTAWANDTGYSQVFSNQLPENLTHRDCVIGISASGSSINIVEVISKAKRMKSRTLALVGYAGKANERPLHTLPDHTIIVPNDSYDIVEDVHNSISHIICRFLKERR